MFTNGDRTLSQSRTTSSGRGDLGARQSKNEAQKEHFIAHNARRRCLKKKFDGIQDRFQRDSTYRDSQLKIGWTEEKSIEMDKLTQEDHSHCPSHFSQTARCSRTLSKGFGCSCDQTLVCVCKTRTSSEIFVFSPSLGSR